MTIQTAIPATDTGLPRKLGLLERIYRVEGVLQCYLLSTDSNLNAAPLFGETHFMPLLAVETALDMLREIGMDVDRLEMEACK